MNRNPRSHLVVRLFVVGALSSVGMLVTLPRALAAAPAGAAPSPAPAPAPVPTAPATAAPAPLPPAPPAGWPPQPNPYTPPPGGYTPPPSPYAPAPGPYAPPLAYAPAGPPAEVPLRRFRGKLEFAVGVFDPTDVNDYIRRQVSGATSVQGFSEMRMLLGLDASGAFYANRFLGIRPRLQYFFAPKVITVYGGSNHNYWLHSVAPGVALDLAVDTGGLVRWFASPGVSYQWGWFEGVNASGLGADLVLGAELSFGRNRSKGISLSLAFRTADLKTTGTVGLGESQIRTLDFSSVLFRVGFQFGG